MHGDQHMLETHISDRKPTNVRGKSANDRTAIYTSIVRSIRDGRLVAKAKLPTERELSDTYGAARNTVRKAMDRLVEEGFVTRQVGRGTFVVEHAAVDDDSAIPQDTPSLPEILEARLLFEPEIAQLVVERAEVDDFAEMDRCLAGLRDSENWRQYKEWKYALHMAMVRATRNRFLVQMFEAVIRARRQDGWGDRGVTAQVSAAVRSAALRSNTEIVEALRRGDAQSARQSMHDYLTRTLATVHGF